MERAFHFEQMMIQASTLNLQLEEMSSQSESIILDIQQFAQNDELQSNAYTAVKTYFSEVYGNLYQSIIYAAQEMIQANNSLNQSYQSILGKDYINTACLEYNLGNLQRQILNLRSSPLESVFQQQTIDLYEKLCREIIADLEGMEYFNRFTAHLFQNAQCYFEFVQQGLKQVENNPLNVDTMSFASIDMTWANNMKAFRIEKTSQSYIANGAITEAGYTFFEDSMKKNKEDLTWEELQLLLNIMESVDTPEEAQRILNAGYCTPGNLSTANTMLPPGTGSVGVSDTFLFVTLATLQQRQLTPPSPEDNKGWEVQERNNLYLCGMVQYALHHPVIFDVEHMQGMNSKVVKNVMVSITKDETGDLQSIDFRDTLNGTFREMKLGRGGAAEIDVWSMEDISIENKAMLERVQGILSLAAATIGVLDMFGKVSTTLANGIGTLDTMSTIKSSMELYPELFGTSNATTFGYDGYSGIAASHLADKLNLRVYSFSGGVTLKEIENNYMFLPSKKTQQALDTFNKELEDFNTYGVRGSENIRVLKQIVINNPNLVISKSQDEEIPYKVKFKPINIQYFSTNQHNIKELNDLSEKSKEEIDNIKEGISK